MYRPCVRKDKLFTLYSIAVLAFSRDVSSLRGTMEHEDYTILLTAAEASRAESVARRLDYQQHVLKHGC
jgi:hypothetical protein